MAHHPVAHRIRRILNLEDEPMLVSRKTLVAVATGILSLVLAVGLVAPRSTDAEEPAATTEASRVVPDPDTEELATEDTEEEKNADIDKVIETGKTTVQFSPHPKTPAELDMLIRDIQTIQQRIFDAKEELVELEVNHELQSRILPPDVETQRIMSEYPMRRKALNQIIADKQKELDLKKNEIEPTPNFPPHVFEPGKTIVQYFPHPESPEKISEAIKKLNEIGHNVTIRANDKGTALLIQDDVPLETEFGKHPFPTLEEQRAADVAYKILGIELEKLSEEDLKRVQAKGYRGGMRVTSGAKGGGFGGPLEYDDLLVGLHVWPTESFNQVNEILQRYDLHDLNPLKFYVIRHVIDDVRVKPEGEDRVVTGRVNVDLNAWAEKEGFKKARVQSDLSDEEKLQRMAETQPEHDKETLLYDGKTFEVWKTIWRQDLSPEVRTKAVHAFVAFSNTGKGKEAVDEIMAIVEEYDWNYTGGNDARGRLQDACIHAFREREGQLPTDLALESVVSAANSKNPRVRGFLQYVVEPLFHASKEANSALREKFPEIGLPESKPKLFNNPTPREGPPLSGESTGRYESHEKLQLKILPYNKKPLAGSRSTYQFFIENAGDSPVEQIQMTVKFPPEIIPDMATLESIVKGDLADNEIHFAPIAALRSKERVSFTITTSLLKAGIVTIDAKVKSKNLPEGSEVSKQVEIVGE